MFNVYYENPMYKNNLKKIDSEEGLGLGVEYSPLINITMPHSKRIQKIMSDKAINLTLEECYGLYHSWSTGTCDAAWLTHIDDMSDDDLYHVMSDWLLKITKDNMHRMFNLQYEVMISRIK